MRSQSIQRAVPCAAVAVALVVAVVVISPAIRAAPRAMEVADARMQEQPTVVDTRPEADVVPGDRSPDGKHLAFAVPASRAGRSAVWVARSDGSAARPVVTCRSSLCVRIAEPAYSPDGRRLLVVQSDGAAAGGRGPSRLLVVDLRTGRSHEVTRTSDGTSGFAAPRWAPDERSAAVQLTRYPDARDPVPSGSVVQIVSIRSGTTRSITPSSLRAGHPDFRRSDGLIVLGSWDLTTFATAGGRSLLYTVHADGTGLRRLTDLRSPEHFRFGDPRWRPDGRSIEVTVAVARHPRGRGGELTTWWATISTPGGRIVETFGR